MQRLMRFTWLGLVAILTACGGGGGGASTPPAQPVVPPTVAAFPTATPAPTGLPSVPIMTYNGPTATVAAVGTVSGGANSPAASSRARSVFSLRQLKSVSSVSISGTITPTTVQAPAVSAYQTVSATSGSVSIGLTFSNVPVGNNAVLVVRLSAVAPDGSSYFLGSLCALVNVSSTTVNSTTLSLASTQRCLVASALQQQGLLTADDWTDATLDTRLSTYITSAGITPDPTYQIFSVTALQTLVTSVTPSLGRKLTITTSPALPFGKASVSFDQALSAIDATVAQSALNGLYGLYGLVPYLNATTLPSGSPNCFTTVPPIAGNSVSLPPVPYNNYCTTTTLLTLNAAGTATATVYGRGMRVTVAASPSPFPSASPTGAAFVSPAPIVGGNTAAPVVAAGTTGTIAVSVASAQQTVTVTDALASGFGISSFNDEYTLDVPASTLSNTTAYYYYNSNAQGFQYAGTSGSTLTFQVGTVNPYDPTGSTKFCGGSSQLPQCATLTGSGGALTIVRPFQDPGTNVSVFNYTGSGFLGTPTSTAGGTSYTVPVAAYAAGATGTLTTTTPTYLLGSGSSYNFGTATVSVYGSYAPTPWTLKVTAVTPSGTITSTTSPASNYSFSVQFANLPTTQFTSVSQLTFTFTAATASASSSTLTLNRITPY